MTNRDVHPYHAPTDPNLQYNKGVVVVASGGDVCVDGTVARTTTLFLHCNPSGTLRCLLLLLFARHAALTLSLPYPFLPYPLPEPLPPFTLCADRQHNALLLWLNYEKTSPQEILASLEDSNLLKAL